MGGARLLAVVTLKPGEQGRYYRLPMTQDYKAVWQAMKFLEKVAMEKLPNSLNPVPDEALPPQGTLGFRVQLYGMTQWGDLFTARQKLALVTLGQQIRLARDTRALLALAMSRVSERLSSLARWDNSPKMETVAGTFARQALPIIWDFAEQNPFAAVGGNWEGAVEWIAQIAHECQFSIIGQVQVVDACESPLPDTAASIWFTDPPYYDAVPYADLSDFFFVWLKRVLPAHLLLQDPFDPDNLLTPKAREAVQDEVKQVNGRPKDRDFFEGTMARAFAEGRRILKEDGVGCVVFAHKTTEGWEALLSGMIQGDWVITGSWPITTEMPNRLRARESAALATSVHLICRPRPEDASVGDWGDVLRELPRRVGDWMERLQNEGVRGADLVFACIGPALEIFSRYKSVETAEGREVSLSEFLEKVWEVVGRIALEQILGAAEANARNGAAGAMEEDARLTALFLWTLQSTDIEALNNSSNESEDDITEEEDEESEAPKSKQKGFSLIFDVVRRFAQPLGIHLDQWRNRIIETKKGMVRLLSVTERARQLFGEEGAQAVADHLERNTDGVVQLQLFSASGERPLSSSIGRGRGRRKQPGTSMTEESFTNQHTMTTLDRVHIAMLLQAGGRTNALRTLLAAEQERGTDFLRLANALSALYPKISEEKRLLDAMLLAMPR
jgi:adenine-specific DNA methylase